MRLITGAIFILLLFISLAFPFTDQTTTERILKESRLFIDFLNVSLTNFGDQNRIEQYKKIYSKHFNAYVSFLQSDYKATFKKLYGAQGKQSDLYSDIVKNLYLESSKDILDALAPIIIKSKNTKAKHYLSLGYRERTVGKNNYAIGKASNPRLYSYKIWQYMKAIKRARRAKRYGFLALYESQNYKGKRKIFEHLYETEKKAGILFFNRFLKKTGDSFINEINKSYGEHKESIEKSKNNDPKKVEGKDITEKQDSKISGKEIFEKAIEKRVRFRKEREAARFILNADFDRAENITRKYINDFNFKIIQATFEVLTTAKDEGSAEGSKAGTKVNSKEDAAGARKGVSNENVDYNSFKTHHLDNYIRLAKQSIIETFADNLEVDDDVEKTALDKGNKVKDEIDKKDVKDIDSTESKDTKDSEKSPGEK